MELPSAIASDWATLVIDVQNDFCHPEGAKAQLGDDISANQRMLARLPPFLNRLRDLGSPIIFLAQTVSRSTVSAARARQTEQRGRGPFSICAIGTWGAEICEEAGSHPNDLRLEKHRYSGFVGTELFLVLRSLNVQGVIVLGTSANVCVDSTARDAFMRDFHVVIPKELVGHSRADLAASALRNFQRYFGTLCSADDLLSEFEYALEVEDASELRS